MSETAKTWGENLVQLIDNLTGNRSGLKLNFKNLTLEVAEFQVKLNKSIVLNILYVSEG